MNKPSQQFIGSCLLWPTFYSTQTNPAQAVGLYLWRDWFCGPAPVRHLHPMTLRLFPPPPPPPTPVDSSPWIGSVFVAQGIPRESSPREWSKRHLSFLPVFCTYRLPFLFIISLHDQSMIQSLSMIQYLNGNTLHLGSADWIWPATFLGGSPMLAHIDVLKFMSVVRLHRRHM